MMFTEYIFWFTFLLLIYIYAGYPLLVVFRARFFPRPVKKGEFQGTCSILIAARNEALRLPDKIESLLAQSRQDSILEILIGSDASTDETVKVLRQLKDPRIKVFEFTERRGKPSVLNDLMREARGDIVIMNDARQVLAVDAVEKLQAPFADSKVGVVSGELDFIHEGESTAARGIGAYWRYEKIIRNAEGLVHSVPGATGALYAIRRSLLKPIPANTLCDDVAIPMQAVVEGYRCIFEPGAKVYDRPSSSPTQEATRKRRTIAGVAQLLCLFPRWLLPWQNPIWFGYISHKMLRLLSPFCLLALIWANYWLRAESYYQWIGWGQIIFYGLALAGLFSQRCGVNVRMLGIPAMFLSMNVTTLAALWDAMRGRYHAAWNQAYQPLVKKEIATTDDADKRG